MLPVAAKFKVVSVCKGKLAIFSLLLHNHLLLVFPGSFGNIMKSLRPPAALVGGEHAVSGVETSFLPLLEREPFNGQHSASILYSLSVHRGECYLTISSFPRRLVLEE